MDLKEIDILGEDIGSHWYYSCKAKAMAKLLGGLKPKVILDVGAGSAFFSRYLLNHTDAVTAWCVDVSYEADSDDVEAGKELRFRRSVDSVNADLVLLMDVLEHVDNDAELVSEYVNKVPDGSYFLISVPAFQFLWSGHDEFLEHKRRYTLAQLEEVLQKSGLIVKNGCYFFAAVFPIAAGLRMAQSKRQNKEPASSQLTRHSAVVNALLKVLCVMELPFMKFNRAAGLTSILFGTEATESPIPRTG